MVNLGRLLGYLKPKEITQIPFVPIIQMAGRLGNTDQGKCVNKNGSPHFDRNS